MALTIIQQPAEYQPIHHPMMYLVESTFASEDNFKVVFTVVNNSSNPWVIRVSPRPGDSYAELDIAPHVRNYIDAAGFDLPTADTFTEAPYVVSAVIVSEQYTDASGDLIVTAGTAAQVVLSAKYGTDIVLDRVEELTFNEERYRLSDNGSLPFYSELLFNTNPGDTIYKDDYFYIHVVGKPNSNPISAVITEYNGAGGAVSSTTIVAPTTLNATEAKFLKLDMNTISWDATTTEVKIRFVDNTNTTVSGSKTYKLADSRCGSWDDYKFLYKDKLGSMNMINLNKYSTADMTIKPKTFNKRLDSFTQTGTSRGTTRYTQSVEEVLTANTDNLRVDQVYKVEDLLLSNVTFLDVRDKDEWGTLEFVPVEILTTRMNKPSGGNQEIPQYTIQFRYGFNKVTRR